MPKSASKLMQLCVIHKGCVYLNIKFDANGKPVKYFDRFAMKKKKKTGRFASLMRAHKANKIRLRKMRTAMI